MKKFSILFGFLSFVGTLTAGISPLAPQCEYQTNPLAVDEPQPLLSWQLTADRRAEVQTAYRIMVASSPELLAQEKPNLWDSGKVSSPEQNHIPYAGKTLSSLQMCYWTVGVWDRDQKFGGWSEPATWTMGILQDQDWKATFIELPETIVGEALTWVWYPGELFAPAGKCYFRKTLEIGGEIASAEFILTADNSFNLFINGESAGSGASYKNFFKFNVQKFLKSGLNQLAIQATNEGTQANEAGLIGTLQVKTKRGEMIEFPINQQWKVSTKESEGWTDINFREETDWVAAAVRGNYGMKPWGNIQVSETQMPIFRRGFVIEKAIKRALVHICGLGQYELSLNGKKVGDSFIDPGWTNYRKTCLYSTYEITDQLAEGGNVLGVMLGNGMYNVRGGRYTKFTGSFGTPKVICRLQIDYTDGTSQIIGTDENWQTAPGPITFSCTYGGEDYDARLEIANWDTPSCTSDAWQAASPTEGPGGKLRSQYAPPVKVMQQFTAVNVTEPKPGLYVVDLGQNFSGYPEMYAIGREGQTIKLRPGEVLNDDGTVCQSNSGQPVYFDYTFGKMSEENPVIHWAPRFTYYGFRYVQIEGAGVITIGSPQADGTEKHFHFIDQTRVEGGTLKQTQENGTNTVVVNFDTLPVVIAGITGNFTYASAEKAGTFNCSNELINRIDKLIRMAIYSNFQSVFTDCPHREKLGWLEQDHLMANGLIANLSLMRHYTKMMRDCAEAQTDKGLITDIAPEYVVFSPDFRDSPEWGSTFILAPWYVWLHYGDTRLIERYYENMKDYIAYLESKKDANGMISHGLGDWCDVGPGPSGYAQLTSKEITATGTYYQDLMAMIQFAKILDKKQDLNELTAKAEAMKVLFNSRMYHPAEGYYDKNSQTGNAFPLVVGLVEDANKNAVTTNLLQSVVKENNRITAGDVGFSYLVKALIDSGNHQPLFDLVTQTNNSGYWWMLEQGCTSLHESWKVERTASFNHFMLGHADEWFYRGIGGINPSTEGPGYAKFILRPQVTGDLTQANVTYQSIRGEIQSQWKLDDRHFVYTIHIPANSTATVYLPATDTAATSIKEGEFTLKNHPQIQILGTESNTVKLQVPSGDYTLISVYQP